MSVCYSVQAEPDLPQGADLSAQLLPPTSGAAILAVSPGGTITPAEDLEPKARLPVVSIIYHLNFKFGRTQD